MLTSMPECCFETCTAKQQPSLAAMIHNCTRVAFRPLHSATLSAQSAVQCLSRFATTSPRLHPRCRNWHLNSRWRTRTCTPRSRHCGLRCVDHTAGWWRLTASQSSGRRCRMVLTRIRRRRGRKSRPPIHPCTHSEILRLARLLDGNCYTSRRCGMDRRRR